MEESFRFIPAFVGFQLHGAYGGAEFASGGASFAYKDAAVVFGQLAAAWRYP